MVNTCQVIIKSGINKGKKCCETNSRCKHSDIKVCICGYSSPYPSNFNRHRKMCKNTKPKPIIKPKQQVKISTLPKPASSPVPEPQTQTTSSETEPVISPELLMQKQFLDAMNNPLLKQMYSMMSNMSGTNNSKLGDIYNVLQQMTDNMNRMRDEITDAKVAIQENSEEIKNRPINTTVNLNNYNIAIMNTDIFKELVVKEGHEHAIKVLTNAAAHNRPINVLKELYFKGDPNEYPIASKNGRYRYLNEDGNLVEDGGILVSKMIAGRLQKAMSYAAGTLIREMTKEGTAEKLYDVYDIGKIQNNIYNFPIETIIHDLGHVTENPTHPFFMDGVSVICLEES